MFTILAIGDGKCRKDVLAKTKSTFKEIYGVTYEEKVNNIIQLYDKDNSLGNKEFFKTKIAKDMILLSTRYYKSWVASSAIKQKQLNQY